MSHTQEAYSKHELHTRTELIIQQDRNKETWKQIRAHQHIKHTVVHYHI